MAHTIVIFGASGDLTKRKLIPALYSLFRKKRLPPDTRIVGFSRSPFTSEAWRNELAESTAQFLNRDFDPAVWAEFAPAVSYHPGNIEKVEDFRSLDLALAEMEGNSQAIRAYYLATAPQSFEPAIEHLGTAGMADETTAPRRIVLEKPFGVDLDSARHLNDVVHQVFSESQVYRIDHYLGKETVQNLMVLRFANSIFEPIWNRNYIDHVQITAWPRT